MTDEQLIRDLQTAWFAATTDGDLPRLLTLMADDVVFLTPGRAPFGKDAFAANFSAGLGHVRIDIQGEFEEIVVVGDVAYARGHLAVTVSPLAGGEPKVLSGYTLSVFRRQSPSNWVLARDANLLTPANASA